MGDLMAVWKGIELAESKAGPSADARAAPTES